MGLEKGKKRERAIYALYGRNNQPNSLVDFQNALYSITASTSYNSSQQT